MKKVISYLNILCLTLVSMPAHSSESYEELMDFEKISMKTLSFDVGVNPGSCSIELKDKRLFDDFESRCLKAEGKVNLSVKIMVVFGSLRRSLLHHMLKILINYMKALLNYGQKA